MAGEASLLVARGASPSSTRPTLGDSNANMKLLGGVEAEYTAVVAEAERLEAESRQAAARFRLLKTKVLTFQEAGHVESPIRGIF